MILGVPKPAWFQSATWVDTSRERVWRAELRATLAVPDTADRVHAEFREDLDCRSGKIAQLWVCGNILRMAAQRADAHDLAEPARVAADQLVTDLR